MQSSSQAGKSSSDPTVEAGFGGHRRRGDGDAGRCECRGNLEIHQSARPGERGRGETQELILGTAGRCRIRGNPETHRESGAGRTGFGVTRRLSASNAEGCERRGNSKLHRRRSRKMQDSGIPGDSSGGEAERSTRETWSFREGSAEGDEKRGDSKLDRRRSRRVRQSGQPEDSLGSAAGSEDAGQPGTSWRVALNDARGEETRISHRRRRPGTRKRGNLETGQPGIGVTWNRQRQAEGTMHGLSNL